MFAKGGGSGYVGPIVTVDTVCATVSEARLRFVTITRRRAPERGRRALPGVYVQNGETIAQASDRCLADKCGIVLPSDTQRFTVGVHDSVARDPRGHSLSIAHLALIPNFDDALPDSGTLAAGAVLEPVGAPRTLAFDHDDILEETLAWMRQHLWTEPRVFLGLLGPSPATSGAIADVDEAVTGVRLDPSNLRRRIAASNLFSPTGEQRATGVGRPGKVWRLNR
ncbi:MAG TPA: hypothetical protein VMM60_13895 [Ilumatobacter sp.]|nr:hypothetical protein [Ilumatobacter sp.]